MRSSSLSSGDPKQQTLFRFVYSDAVLNAISRKYDCDLKDLVQFFSSLSSSDHHTPAPVATGSTDNSGRPARRSSPSKPTRAEHAKSESSSSSSLVVEIKGLGSIYDDEMQKRYENYTNSREAGRKHGIRDTDATGRRRDGKTKAARERHGRRSSSKPGA